MPYKILPLTLILRSWISLLTIIFCLQCQHIQDSWFWGWSQKVNADDTLIMQWTGVYGSFATTDPFYLISCISLNIKQIDPCKYPNEYLVIINLPIAYYLTLTFSAFTSVFVLMPWKLVRMRNVPSPAALLLRKLSMMVSRIHLIIMLINLSVCVFQYHR